MTELKYERTNLLLFFKELIYKERVLLKILLLLLFPGNSLAFLFINECEVFIEFSHTVNTNSE